MRRTDEEFEDYSTNKDSDAAEAAIDTTIPSESDVSLPRANKQPRLGTPFQIQAKAGVSLVWC